MSRCTERSKTCVPANQIARYTGGFKIVRAGRQRRSPRRRYFIQVNYTFSGNFFWGIFVESFLWSRLLTICKRKRREAVGSSTFLFPPPCWCVSPSPVTRWGHRLHRVLPRSRRACAECHRCTSLAALNLALERFESCPESRECLCHGRGREEEAGS